MRAEISVAELWNKEFLEAGKKRLSGDTTREATSDEVEELRKENQNRFKFFRIIYEFWKISSEGMSILMAIINAIF